MNPILWEILRALFDAHQTIDALRERISELETKKEAVSADSEAVL